MSKTHLDVQATAQLARIALTEDEIATFGPQLEKALEHIDLLARVDITGVEPTAHASPVFNVLRDDEPTPGLSREEALRNAPRSANNLLVVPRVIE